MTLHIYNPEHDIALACNQWNFSLPRAAKLTRERFWDVPLRWAKEGDLLLVERKVENGKWRVESGKRGIRLVTLENLARMTAEELPNRIEPWGWDRYIVHQLVTANKLFEPLCPTDEQLQLIRMMSSREFAATKILPQLVALGDEFIGESQVFRGAVEKLEEIVKKDGFIVLKSPWSCSGRGVKFINGSLTDSDRGWVRNILDQQGAIMIEPQYDNLLDFAMEFRYIEGKVEYLGINVFETQNGRYIRNLGPEKIQEFGIDGQLGKIRNKIIEISYSLLPITYYLNNFGIDMMLVRDKDGKTKVHPCVEMNLRKTMGA